MRNEEAEKTENESFENVESSDTLTHPSHSGSSENSTCAVEQSMDKEEKKKTTKTAHTLDMAAMEELTCHICQEMLVNPTTLSCGHSFCRHCLAQWNISSFHRKCAVCQAPWNDIPSINISLRNTIDQLYPDAARIRNDAILNDLNAQKAIEDFDTLKSQNQGAVPGPGGQALSPEQTQQLIRLQQQLGAAMEEQVIPALGRISKKAELCCKATLLVLFVFLVVAVSQTYYSYFTTSEIPLKTKPVTSWTSDDVMTWLKTSVDPLTEQVLSRAFNEKKINGALLLSLTEKDLDESKLSDLQKRAFFLTVKTLQTDGVKAPSGLIEYKDRHLGKTVLLLATLRDFPRTTMLILYLWDYNDSFLPLVHVTCPASEKYDVTQISWYSYDFADLTLSQWSCFTAWSAVTPYFVIAQFAGHSGASFLTVFLIAFTCAAMTVVEVIAVLYFIKLHSLKIINDMVGVTENRRRFMGFCVVCMLLWPVIPTFIVNMWFYFTLFTAPIEPCYLIYNKYSLARNGDDHGGQVLPR